MNILCYGYYGPDKRNVGDMLFKEAFNKLFPEHIFTFTDIITKEDLSKADAVFIGGGSLLDGAPSFCMEFYEWPKPIIYLGVGAETNINAQHITPMRNAKLICTRTPGHIEKVRAINPNVIAAPDLVYSLASEITAKPIEKTVLVLPNINMVPMHSSAHWQHIVWNLYRAELAAALDILIERGFMVRFYGMDQTDKMMDEWASQEIINAMENRNNNYIIRGYFGSKSLLEMVRSFDMVITSRYHGVICAELAQVPYASIAHHSKLMGAGYRAGCFMTVNEASKDRLLKAVETRHSQVKADIQLSDFDELKKRVKEVLQPA